MASDRRDVLPAPASPGSPHRDGGLPEGRVRLEVAEVMLLGVRVRAVGVLDRGEHERRTACGLRAVTDPQVLDRLLDLPVDVPVTDSVVWAETALQPPGVVDRHDDGQSLTRLLRVPVALESVTVTSAPGRDLRSVQDASLFADYARRWVQLRGREVGDAVAMEAALCGVGLRAGDGGVLMDAEDPASPLVDGWSWLLREKVYARWVSERPAPRGKPSRAQSTAAAKA